MVGGGTMMTSRTVLFMLVVALLAACGQQATAPGEDRPPTDDTAANEQTVTNATSDSTGPAMGGVATGVVIDRAGQPVVGVLIEARSLDEPPQPVPELAVVTDGRGRYVWPLKPGRYELLAHADDRPSSPAQVEVTAGGTAQADLTVG
jgi:Carboxypeptidase regulatory-like domain